MRGITEIYGWASCTSFTWPGPDGQVMTAIEAVMNADSYAFFGIGEFGAIFASHKQIVIESKLTLGL